MLRDSILVSSGLRYMSMLNSIYHYILWFKLAFTLAILAWFSYYDSKYREIPDKHVWVTFAISLLLFGVSLPYYISYYRVQVVVVYVIFSVFVGIGFFYLLYVFGLMGKADVFVTAELVFLYPFIDIYEIVFLKSKREILIPPITAILIYSALFSILLVVFKSTLTALKHREALPRDIPGYAKLMLLVVGNPMRIREYLESKFYYPLTLLIVEGSSVRKEYRFSFNAEKEDYREHQKYFRELVEKGLVSPEDYIWVTYGIPFLIPLLLGFTTFMIVGDVPVCYIFSLCS